VTGEGLTPRLRSSEEVEGAARREKQSWGDGAELFRQGMFDHPKSKTMDVQNPQAKVMEKVQKPLSSVSRALWPVRGNPTSSVNQH